MLQSLQAVRKAEHEAAIKEASALLKLSEMKGLAYDPAKAAQAQVRCAANSRQDGFEFANDQIHAAINREQRLQRTAAIDFSRYKRRTFHAQAA